MTVSPFRRWLVVSILVASFTPFARSAIRVVTYNVNADTDRNKDGAYTLADGTYATASVASVLEAIGSYSLAGNAQAPDVISVQEPYATPSVTLSSIVGSLNAYYGAGTYDYDKTVGATTGSATQGNASNALIFRTSTVKVNAVVQVGTPDGNGESRAPLRYQLTALGTATNNTFYLYSEHTKASSGSVNAMRRTYELDAVRADADALGSSAHVIFTGDFNLAGNSTATAATTSGSNEQGYKDLTAANGTTLATNGDPNSSAAKIVAGAVRAYDPQTGTFANDSDAYAKYYTESDTSLTARFDLQLLTANTLATSTSLGLRLVNQTELAFGNSYYTAAGTLASLNGSGDSITDHNVAATTGYSSATLASILAASDHLPVVADYVIAVPEPTTLAGLAFGATFMRRRRA